MTRNTVVKCFDLPISYSFVRSSAYFDDNKLWQCYHSLVFARSVDQSDWWETRGNAERWGVGERAWELSLIRSHFPSCYLSTPFWATHRLKSFFSKRRIPELKCFSASYFRLCMYSRLFRLFFPLSISFVFKEDPTNASLTFPPYYSLYSYRHANQRFQCQFESPPHLNSHSRQWPRKWSTIEFLWTQFQPPLLSAVGYVMSTRKNLPSNIHSSLDSLGYLIRCWPSIV